MADADHAYLDARVSMMATGLHDPDTIDRLATLPLSALVDQLGLDALLDAAPSPRARSRAIEQALVHQLLAELQVLIRPLQGDERELMLAWGRKYALYNLKTLLRGKLHALEAETIAEQLFDLPAPIRLPIHTLFRAESVEELLRQLETGPYRQIARQAREVYARRREPFALEAAIDQHYYLGLARHVRTFGAPHGTALRRLIGAALDRVDLLWLLRFRLCYGLSPSETFYWLVPSTGLLGRERLLRLVALDGLEPVIEALPAPLAGQLAGSEDIAEVQRRVNIHSATIARALLAHGDSAPARALAYLMLREADLLRLFAIIQGRLLGLAQHTIDAALERAPSGCTWRAAACTRREET
ncbi:MULTISPECIES: V-type ATPase subunit [Marichromatium]|uniref:V/A-type H+-transporting ATPase subunit C n=1 Tax=Marichromatium gracile TaxID=1048 RepID=A0A4R4AAM3_MARGR|nr:MULTISPECIES: V-type ATPase subunit [Marichromatium]MBK1708843.1 ATPase [Marichromatium gracile]RNE90355.1 ATPase [Marichromatium sp. AB31]RNE94638.1 ATPase [Marichromatium sp. AB32]TCW35905.1 V/A-type H+-transporting ATPase subunit C [Marichromatium gracile]